MNGPEPPLRDNRHDISPTGDHGDSAWPDDDLGWFPRKTCHPSKAIPPRSLGTYGDGAILSQNALSLVATTSDGELNENTPGATPVAYDGGARLRSPCNWRRWSRTAPSRGDDGWRHAGSCSSGRSR